MGVPATKTNFDFRAEANALGGTMLPLVKRAAAKVAARARELAPEDSGKLRGNIRHGAVERQWGLSGWVKDVAPHAMVVEVGGTRDVRGGKGTAPDLPWQAPGTKAKDRRRRRKHVFREPDPFLHTAVDEYFDRFQADVDKAITEVVS